MVLGSEQWWDGTEPSTPLGVPSKPLVNAGSGRYLGNWVSDPIPLSPFCHQIHSSLSPHRCSLQCPESFGAWMPFPSFGCLCLHPLSVWLWCVTESCTKTQRLHHHLRIGLAAQERSCLELCLCFGEGDGTAGNKGRHCGIIRAHRLCTQHTGNMFRERCVTDGSGSPVPCKQFLYLFFFICNVKELLHL